jgi:formiminoglutamase
MISTNFKLNTSTREQIISFSSLRNGEQKLGENVKSIEDNYSSCKYVILGISEDFGPQLNKGGAGANSNFEPFASRFLSMQSNEFLDGKDIFFLGEIVLQEKKNPKVNCNLIDELDEFVVSVVDKYVSTSQIPIVIGGGHNNAFPLIKAQSLKIEAKINVINLDAHADFRKTDGRHSGNPFSYAFEGGFLENYFVLGLQQSYNNQFLIDSLRNANAKFTWFDDYIMNRDLFSSDLKKFAKLVSENNFGIELDLDAIAFMPSSAVSPSGFSVEDARKYILKLASNKNVVYLHLPEAAPKTDDEKLLVGKTLAFFVSDFIKSNQKTN